MGFHKIEDVKEFDVINTKPARYHVVSKDGMLICEKVDWTGIRLPKDENIRSIDYVLNMGGMIIGNSRENPELIDLALALKSL